MTDQEKIADLEKRLAEVEAKAEGLAGALRRVEWVTNEENTGEWCISCGGSKPHHAPGCYVAAALTTQEKP